MDREQHQHYQNAQIVLLIIYITLLMAITLSK